MVHIEGQQSLRRKYKNGKFNNNLNYVIVCITHCTCLGSYKRCVTKLTQVEFMYDYFLYSKKTSRSSYDNTKNDRKEKCDDIANKHILKANCHCFRSYIYLHIHKNT